MRSAESHCLKESDVQRAADAQPPDGRRNVLLLGLVSLFNDTSSEIIRPIMPLLITSLGGGAVAVGIVGGLGEGIPSILKILSGYAGDLIGRRKPLVIAGYGVSAIAKIFLPMVWIWQQVVLLNTLERCGKGIRSAPKDAIIADSSTNMGMGKGFGIVRALDTLGAVIGSAAAYLLWSAGLSLKDILWIAAVLSVIAFIPLAFVSEISRSPLYKLRPDISSLPPELRWFVIIASIFALSNFSYMFFMLKAQELFTGTLAIGAPLMLYVLFNIVYAAMAIPSGITSDRIGRRWTLVSGYMLFSIVTLCFAFVSSARLLVPLFILYGLVFAIVEGAQSAYVSELSCDERRCTALGAYYGIVGFASIISGLIAGALWQTYGSTATFLFGTILAAIASLGMIQTTRSKTAIHKPVK